MKKVHLDAPTKKGIPGRSDTKRYTLTMEKKREQSPLQPLRTWAQSNTLCISVTASLPRGAMSPPVKMAYSKPECLARPLAKRVLPVPGGPAGFYSFYTGGGKGGAFEADILLFNVHTMLKLQYLSVRGPACWHSLNHFGYHTIRFSIPNPI